MVDGIPRVDVPIDIVVDEDDYSVVENEDGLQTRTHVVRKHVEASIGKKRNHKELGAEFDNELNDEGGAKVYKDFPAKPKKKKYPKKVHEGHVMLETSRDIGPQSGPKKVVQTMRVPATVGSQDLLDSKKKITRTFQGGAKPAFLKSVAPISSRLDSATCRPGECWWQRSRPEVCGEPIVAIEICRSPQRQLRWSYSVRDRKCYQYVDRCAYLRANSFDTAALCVVSCWRKDF